MMKTLVISIYIMILVYGATLIIVIQLDKTHYKKCYNALQHVYNEVEVVENDNNWHMKDSKVDCPSSIVSKRCYIQNIENKVSRYCVGIQNSERWLWEENTNSNDKEHIVSVHGRARNRSKCQIIVTNNTNHDMNTEYAKCQSWMDMLLFFRASVY
jgi:hypothetical protein